MTQYYYIVSSLPHLSYSMEKIPSVEQFTESVTNHLTAKEAEMVLTAGINDFEKRDTAGSEVLRKWYTWEINLRNRLARLRGKNKNIDHEEFIRENPGLFTGDTIPEDAVKDESPLNGEDILNRGRWAFLDELETGHYFDMDKLIIYHLKLQVLQRKSLFSKERGAEKFQKIVDDIAARDFPRGGKKKDSTVRNEVADGK